jgi:uncharacterized phiE125 gp8 family phage protein
MKTVLMTGPPGMVVSLAEAKAHLRVDHTADDGYIQALIISATDQAENILRRRLITQTWRAYYPGWPWKHTGFIVPFGQLQSVTSVHYRDSYETEYTWDSGEYLVDTASDPGRVILGYSKTYPSETLSPLNPVWIDFTCGYGDHAIKSVTGATNATPIVITSTAHGYVTGDRVMISAVGGNTNANGIWKITRLTADTYSLDASVGNAAYTAATGLCVKVDVPEPIRTVIKLMISDMYDNRESIVVGKPVSEVPGHIVNLLWPYRIWVEA